MSGPAGRAGDGPGGPGGPTTRVVAFAELDARTAYDVWRLRQDVFVVEQACPYPDLDGRDTEPGTRHVLMFSAGGGAAEVAGGGVVAGSGGDLIGCARVLDDGDVWRVGRLLLTPSARGRGLAEPLLRACLDACPGRDVVLDAQSPLRAFYEGAGFEVTGPEFLEDGIAHLPMRRARS